MKIIVGFPFLMFALFHVQSAPADTFGSGTNQFTIDFVTIGNPNNSPDSTGNPKDAGAVPYSYRMGKFEVSLDMMYKASASGGLWINGGQFGVNRPITGLTWRTAAHFVNWLNTSTGHLPAYKFNEYLFELWQPTDVGFDPHNLYRNSRAFYFLPSEDEWYKAAYYDPATGVYYDYPTGSDSVPDGIDWAGDPDFDVVFDDGYRQPLPNDITNVGVLSPYGTAGQGGNVWELLETEYDLVNDTTWNAHSIRGGPWTTFNPQYMRSSARNWINTSTVSATVGFRVASLVPEPNTMLTCLLAGLSVVQKSLGRL